MTVREGPLERPAIEHYSDTPMFNTKAVAQQTGVPAPTLRAWERRYRLLSPERANNAYRLYSERDIMIIRWLKQHVDSGMAISQAIALFRHLNQGQAGEGGGAASAPSMNEEQGDVTDDGSAAFKVAFTQPDPELLAEANEEKLSSLFLHDWPRLSAGSVSNEQLASHNLRLAQVRLLEDFNRFDESAAALLMASMLAVYPVEAVCTELITPTMWEVGKLWADGQATVSMEHFASNFFRGLLTNLLHVTPDAHDGPLAVISCAPGEPHELGALMIALFLRRKGVRVAYLGQSIETAGLLQTIAQLTPALICISLTIPTYLPALKDLAERIQKLSSPRPIFAFGGQAFQQYATIIEQIPGVYLNGDLRSSADQLHRMLLERAENRN